MLTLGGSTSHRTCSGVTRRDALKVGTLGLGGLTLPWWLARRAEAAAGDYVRDKSVVLLFLSGGASHIETFNPNMSGPAPARSVTGEVATRLPGVTFGGTFPLLAAHAEKMSVVRNYRHPVGDHAKAIMHVLNGGQSNGDRDGDAPSIGSIVSRLRGANHPRTGMPTFALLDSDEVDPQYNNEKRRVQVASAPGPLGAACAPFVPGGEGPAMRNLSLNFPRGRVDDRRDLLDRLDHLKRQVDSDRSMESVDRHTAQAFELILGSAAQAFDLSQEDPRLLERYDTSSFRVGKKKFRDSQLGRHFLTARRLIEAGCRFVTIHSAGWDMHADGNNPGIVSGMEMLGRPVDRAVSAFLEDLSDRGMLGDVLLVVTGDFGRTPRINDRGGRDHWPKLCTLAFAGGGLQQGQIIGQSARGNDEPIGDSISTPNMMSTILHTIFDVGALRLARGVPRDLLAAIEEHPPIEPLF
ncbi:MAG: DUF1501 domain-containing protein [Planctomycetaceae bacterium]